MPVCTRASGNLATEDLVHMLVKWVLTPALMNKRLSRQQNESTLIDGLYSGHLIKIGEHNAN